MFMKITVKYKIIKYRERNSKVVSKTKTDSLEFNSQLEYDKWFEKFKKSYSDKYKLKEFHYDSRI